MTPYANYWHAQKYLARVLKNCYYNKIWPESRPSRWNFRSRKLLETYPSYFKLIVHELNLSCNKITAVIYHVNLINVLQVETFSKPIKDV